MHGNFLQDSFIRKMTLFLFTLFLFSAAYLNSVFFYQVKEYSAWQTLNQGGILVMPHTHVLGADNPYRFRIGDCSTQVNLSENGRNQARNIGKRFREYGVDVGIVLHSRWCRARETAALAFPGMTFAEASFDSFNLRPENEFFYTTRAKKIIANWKSSNALVLMTHPENVHALTGVSPAPGEALVLKDFKNTIEVVGKLRF